MRKIVFIASLLISAFSFSQSYKTTIGFKGGYPSLAVNGVLGIDYTFQDLPINISLDTGPVVQLIGNRNLFSWGGGLAVRYTLK